MAAELLVFIAGQLAGRARQLPPERGLRRVLFRYDDDYLSDPGRTPLSVSFPVSAADFEISDWLDGLLPDDINVRRRWQAQQRAAGSDPVSLLATTIGLDCAGAVQFCPPGRADTVTGTAAAGVDWHTEAEIAAWIRKARGGLRWQRLGSAERYSLGGYQTKIALHRDGPRWGTPYGLVPTTHILKPGIDPHPDQTFEDADLIEHVCMTAARGLGLEAATTSLEQFEGERVLVVLRYDRFNDGGRLRRIHQEDLCQALRRPPTEKYQSDGGPTPAEIAEVIRSESVAGAADVARFADALIYNWAIAAGDAHAKNYSLLLEDDGVALAPLYDVMSHLPYRGRKQANNLKTAMKIGDDYRLSRTSRAKAWRLAASQIGLDPDSVADRVEGLVRRTPDAIDAAIDALDPADRASPRAAALSRDMQQRRRDVLAVFAQTRSAPPTGATDP